MVSRGANSAYGTVKTLLSVSSSVSQTVRLERPKGRYSEKSSNPASEDKLEGLAGEHWLLHS